MTKLAKDPMILFRNTTRGKNAKGGDRLQLYLNTEQAVALVEALTACLENPKGVKIDLHTSQKEYQGRAFDSTIAFVKPVSEFGVNRRVTGTGAKSEYVGGGSSVASKIEKLKKEII